MSTLAPIETIRDSWWEVSEALRLCIDETGSHTCDPRDTQVWGIHDGYDRVSRLPDHWHGVFPGAVRVPACIATVSVVEAIDHDLYFAIPEARGVLLHSLATYATDGSARRYLARVALQEAVAHPGITAHSEWIA